MGSHSKPRVEFFSTNENVTGSCTIVTVHMPTENVTFSIDCGLYMGEDDYLENNSAEFAFDPETLNFALVTHNHADHVGRLPLLVKRGYMGKIYTTIDTKQLLQLSLPDCRKVLAKNAEDYDVEYVYSEEDVHKTLRRIESHQFEEPFYPYPGIKVTFFMNGHLIGAGMILIQINLEGYEEVNILAVSDYKKENMFFDVKPLPEEVKKLPLIVLAESTYGNVDSKDAGKPVFVENVKDIMKDKEVLIIPVFSLARGQEVLYTLKKMQLNGDLDENIPIYGDGVLFRKYCDMYKYQLNIRPEMKDFYPENFMFMNEIIREEAIQTHKKRIILTTSGMANYGMALKYVLRFADKETAAFHFVGYTVPESTGYQMINSETGDWISVGFEDKIRKCDVYHTSEFSAHARRDENADFLKTLNIELLLIFHGESEVKEEFKDYCEDNLSNCKRIEVLGNGTIFY